MDLTQHLGSVVGIIGLTITVVQLIKTRLIPAIPQLGAVPGWLYVVGVALLNVGLARHYGFLPGELPIILAALMIGLMSSGAFEVGRSITKPMSQASGSGPQP